MKVSSPRYGYGRRKEKPPLFGDSLSNMKSTLVIGV